MLAMPWRWFALVVALVLAACSVPAIAPTATPPPSPSATIVAAPTAPPSISTPATTAPVVASPVRMQPSTRPAATVLIVATPTPVVAAPTALSAAREGPVFDFDPARSGVNPNERTIGPDNVAMLRVLWSRRLPDVADSTPVYRDGRLYLTLRNGSTVALDARTGEQIWLAPPTGPKITNSSPAIDPSGKWVYAYGLDGSVHKYDAEAGQEVVGGGWPARVTTLTDVEKESSSLNLANGKLYVTTSGYLGDYGHYAGHLVVVNLASGAIEARDPTTGRLLWTSPNGTVGSIHWESPIVVDGKLIISDESGNVTTFGAGNG
jgi:outer membrane protein assembly factor BamB